MIEAPTLELVIMDSGRTGVPVIYARHGPDTALARVECDGDIAQLLKLQRDFEKAIRGEGEELTPEQVRSYGEKLFNLVVRDRVRDLYATLPPQSVLRLHIYGNHPDIQRFPWELFQEPNSVAVPDRNRIIVRIVPTIGVVPREPLPRSQTLRVLFAVAEPDDQRAVDWSETYAQLKQLFDARVAGSRVEMQFIRTATRDALVSALQRGFHVLHFYGHGEVLQGVGHLVLVDDKGHSDFVPANDLATLLSGTTVRLAVLSACQSASGRSINDFTVVSASLVRAGVPAVVANQFPVYTHTIAPFAAALYRELLQSGDIDRAMAEARTHLWFVTKGISATDWAIPVLYRHVASPTVFQ